MYNKETDIVTLQSLDDSICYHIPGELYFPTMKVLFDVKGVAPRGSLPIVNGVPVTRMGCLRSRNFGRCAYRRLLGSLATFATVKIVPQSNANRLLEADADEV
jgi:hypothetical protein